MHDLLAFLPQTSSVPTANTANDSTLRAFGNSLYSEVSEDKREDLTAVPVPTVGLHHSRSKAILFMWSLTSPTAVHLLSG